MIKPDYISCSQEIFDECENLRIRLRADRRFGDTEEFRSQAVKLGNIILNDEYGRYLDELPK